MFYFLVSFVKDPFSGGPFAADGEPIRLYENLKDAEETARASDDGRIFVVNGDRVDIEDGDQPAAHAIPAEAVLNRDPFVPPGLVEAGGGYVVREDAGELELLLIFRRGCWDLPKGKRDTGETIERCAVREVAEEVGIEADSIKVIADLGTTVHGYTWPRKEVYAVKTTQWYAMVTRSTSFSPQEAEDIEAVAWVPWDDAGERLGYANLQKHYAEIDPRELLDALEEH